MLGTIISVMGGVKAAADTYRSVSMVVHGTGMDRVADELRGLRKDLVKLNENTHWARDWRTLTDTGRATQTMSDPAVAAALLDPVQRALGGPVLSSGIIEAPLKLQAVLAKNPKGVLDDITRFEWVEGHRNPDKVPVMFMFEGVRYVGWQKRDVMPFLLDCEMHDLPGLSAPPPLRTPVLSSAAHAAGPEAAHATSRRPAAEAASPRAGLGKSAGDRKPAEPTVQAPQTARTPSGLAPPPRVRGGGRRLLWVVVALGVAGAVYASTSSSFRETGRDSGPYRPYGRSNR
jgi:hypothetical protein